MTTHCTAFGQIIIRDACSQGTLLLLRGDDAACMGFDLCQKKCSKVKLSDMSGSERHDITHPEQSEQVTLT